MLKKIGILFFALTCYLFMSAAEVDAYYRVIPMTINGRSLPGNTSNVITHYSENEVIYIFKTSLDGKWGYVSDDRARVYMSYIRPLTQNELDRYLNTLKQKGITPKSKYRYIYKGSKPLRILMWVVICLILAGSAAMLLTDEPLRSLGVYYATVLLCAAMLVVWAYAQFILCWGLKIVGWIDHYILFGWLVDAFCNGILSIIPFVLDLPTYGLYGIVAGLLPSIIFYGIGSLFNYEDEDYPFAKWIIYVFQIAVFLMILVMDDRDIYLLFNQFMQLDGVPAIASLADSCDWGQYANNVFIIAFYIGTITLLIPRNLVQKLRDKNNVHI